jgi:hypothetical protein
MNDSVSSFRRSLVVCVSLSACAATHPSSVGAAPQAGASTQAASPAAGASGSSADTGREEPTAAACDPKQLALEPLEGDAGMSHRLLRFAVKNIAGVPCTIEGYPAVRVLGSNGSPLASLVT